MGFDDLANPYNQTPTHPGIGVHPSTLYNASRRGVSPPRMGGAQASGNSKPGLREAIRASSPPRMMPTPRYTIGSDGKLVAPSFAASAIYPPTIHSGGPPGPMMAPQPRYSRSQPVAPDQHRMPLDMQAELVPGPMLRGPSPPMMIPGDPAAEMMHYRMLAAHQQQAEQVRMTEASGRMSGPPSRSASPTKTRLDAVVTQGLASSGAAVDARQGLRGQDLQKLYSKLEAQAQAQAPGPYVQPRRAYTDVRGYQVAPPRGFGQY